MIKTILIPVLVGSFAFCAGAADVYSEAADRLVESSQDFESYDFELPSAKNVHLQSDPGVGGIFWRSPEDVSLVKTQVLLDEDTLNQYLDISASETPSESLVRSFVSRPSLSSAVTNAYAATAEYSGFYCQFKTRFTLYDEDLRPTVDSLDRIVLWACKGPAGTSPGKFYVTAGRFTDDLRRVVSCDYAISSLSIDPDVWHEVTIRMISDIQMGARALGFELWIDGVPVVGGADYSIADGPVDGRHFSPEALALVAQRRLFPSLTQPGGNTSVALGGLAFTGIGVADDILVSAAAPAEWAKAPRVFTLRWDAGVSAVKYRVGTDAEVAVPAAEIHKRSLVFEIPAAETPVSVAVEYDAAGGYSQGFWGAEGSCSVVTNAGPSYSFVCDASSADGTGYVRSSRDEIVLGGGGDGAFASFADAKEQAIMQGGMVIVLNDDFSAALDTRDRGQILIDRGEEITIDLNGHTLGNSVGAYATIVNRGKLTIIDSQGGGRVASYSDYAGDDYDFRRTAVNNYASTKFRPELTIRGGTFDGLIDNSGIITNSATMARMEGSLLIGRSAGYPDDPRFVSENVDEFEFNDKLEDPSLYYTYEEPYWKPLTNAFIWCGKGADDKWSNPANWRCNEVPAAGDYAIFPTCGTNFWVADMETGVAVKDILFAGNVILHGSNDFTDVKWTVPASGRVLGDAILAWYGKLPPDLSTLLDERWSGLVAISGVGNSSPKLMTDMLSWGTAGSTVRFNGVRGYYHLLANVIVPWTLELVDGPNGYAWKNDAGFTGSVIEIPRLIGSGSFVSPRNTIPNQQIIIFRDVYGYTGVMDVKGKRVVLGPGDAATLEAGSITWSDGLKIKTGHVYECAVAAFGGTMDVVGNYGDVLANYSATTVGDTAEVVNLIPGDITAEICVTNPVGVVKVSRWSDDAIIVDGRRVVTNLLEAANSLTEIRAPAKSSALQKLTFARYYSSSVVTNGDMVSLRLSLNELAVPVLGAVGDESAKITFADGMASIVVSGAIDGFWYGLEYKESLDAEWPSEPYIWTVAYPLSGGKVELVAPAQGSSGFYRVVVSDVKPGEGGAE